MQQNPTAFVRELEETVRCDQFHDLSEVRAAYKVKIGEDSMRRIAIYDETEKDERRAEQAVVHHYDWTQRWLVKALDWQSWIWYRTVYKVDQTVAMFTVAGGGVVGGWKFVRSWQRKWAQRPQVPE